MEIEISELWRIIRQRWLLIVLLAVVAVVLTGLVNWFLIKPEYQATATMLVQSQTANHQVVYEDLMANEKMLKTYDDILKSRTVAEDVISNLHLSLTSDQLLKMVSVKADSESFITSIVVTDTNLAQAVQIANGFAHSFARKVGTIMQVDNVTMLDEAKVLPGQKPVSPRPVLNMALAGVISVIGGMALAFLLELLDKTVKTEEQIEELLELNVLGTIPSMAPMTKQRAKQRKASKRGDSQSDEGGGAHAFS